MADGGFVCISLDENTCDICGQDTGEPLTRCHTCLNPLTRLVKAGFNEIIHLDRRGHEICFRRDHAVTQQSAFQRSPQTPRRQTGSQPGSPASQRIREYLEGAIHKIIHFSESMSERKAPNDSQQEQKNILNSDTAESKLPKLTMPVPCPNATRVSYRLSPADGISYLSLSPYERRKQYPHRLHRRLSSSESALTDLANQSDESSRSKVRVQLCKTGDPSIRVAADCSDRVPQVGGGGVNLSGDAEDQEPSDMLESPLNGNVWDDKASFTDSQSQIGINRRGTDSLNNETNSNHVQCVCNSDRPAACLRPSQCPLNCNTHENRPEDKELDSVRSVTLTDGTAAAARMDGDCVSAADEDILSEDNVEHNPCYTLFEDEPSEIDNCVCESAKQPVPNEQTSLDQTCPACRHGQDLCTKCGQGEYDMPVSRSATETSNERQTSTAATDCSDKAEDDSNKCALESAEQNGNLPQLNGGKCGVVSTDNKSDWNECQCDNKQVANRDGQDGINKVPCDRCINSKHYLACDQVDHTRCNIHGSNCKAEDIQRKNSMDYMKLDYTCACTPDGESSILEINSKLSELSVADSSESRSCKFKGLKLMEEEHRQEKGSTDALENPSPDKNRKGINIDHGNSGVEQEKAGLDSHGNSNTICTQYKRTSPSHKPIEGCKSVNKRPLAVEIAKSIENDKILAHCRQQPIGSNTIIGKTVSCGEKLTTHESRQNVVLRRATTIGRMHGFTGEVTYRNISSWSRRPQSDDFFIVSRRSGQRKEVHRRSFHVNEKRFARLQNMFRHSIHTFPAHHPSVHPMPIRRSPSDNWQDNSNCKCPSNTYQEPNYKLNSDTKSLQEMSISTENTVKPVTNRQKSDPGPASEKTDSSKEDIKRVKEEELTEAMKYTRDKLLHRCSEDLAVLIEHFSRQIQAVSEELVTLLQERHDLQEQVEMRKVAIEQLLKMQNIPESPCFVDASAIPAGFVLSKSKPAL